MPATFGYETGMAHGHQTYQQSFLVDVPRFELGASTMPR